MKEKGKINLKKYSYSLLIAVIIIEIYLIINTSKQLDENKVVLNTKLDNIIKKKNNIYKLTSDNEKLEKEINNIKKGQSNKLKLYKEKNEELNNINNNIYKDFHKNFEDYEAKVELYEYKIIEDNDTLNELQAELNNKILIRNNLEQELDKNLIN